MLCREGATEFNTKDMKTKCQRRRCPQTMQCFKERPKIAKKELKRTTIRPNIIGIKLMRMMRDLPTKEWIPSKNDQMMSEEKCQTDQRFYHHTDLAKDKDEWRNDNINVNCERPTKKKKGKRDEADMTKINVRSWCVETVSRPLTRSERPDKKR